MRSPSRRLPLVILAAAGTFAGLLILETGARILALIEERREGRLDRDIGVPTVPPPRSVATLGRIIKRSSNPRIVYELLPRLDVVFAGGRLTTSDAGYRGADVARPKPASAYRILGIGDSYMFGQGVSDDETYLARLPSNLEGALTHRTVETVNLAVPGYNTVMEVETLRTHAAVLEPDLVLIEIVGNDLDLPNFLWNAVDVWTPRKSFLFDFVTKRLRNAALEPNAALGLTEAPSEDAGHGVYSREGDGIPDKYKDMVGLASFERAVADLAAFGRSRGIPVLAISHGVWFEADMLRALERNRIPALVLRSALRQRARALGAPDYGRSPLALSSSDLHPSALGHRAVSEELASWLRRLPPFSP